MVENIVYSKSKDKCNKRQADVILFVVYLWRQSIENNYRNHWGRERVPQTISVYYCSISMHGTSAANRLQPIHAVEWNWISLVPYVKNQ